MKPKPVVSTATPATKKWKRIRPVSVSSTTEEDEPKSAQQKKKSRKRIRVLSESDSSDAFVAQPQQEPTKCGQISKRRQTVISKDNPMIMKIFVSKNKATEQPTTDEYEPKSKKQKLTTDNTVLPAVLAADSHRLKNIYPEVYAANSGYASTCALCSKKDKRMVDHYRTYHPEFEVLISRLSPNMLEIGLAGETVARTGSGGFKSICLLCEKSHTYSKIRWVEHYCECMGHDFYTCATCNQTFTDSKKHGLNCCQTNVKQLFKLTMAPTQSTLYAFACRKCNYVQLRHDSLEKHLKSEHDILVEGEIEANILVVILFKTNTIKEEDDAPRPRKSRNKCTLCNVKAWNLVQHFNECHPLSNCSDSNCATLLLNKTLPNVYLEAATKKTYGFCVFCHKYIPGNKETWLHHLLRHTKENLFRCKNCSVTFKSERFHLKTSKDGCQRSQIKITVNVSGTENGFYGHICLICNLVQFSKKRIERHLRKNHGISEEKCTDNYKRMVIFNFEEGERGSPESLIKMEKNDQQTIKMKECRIVLDVCHITDDQPDKSQNIEPSPVPAVQIKTEPIDEEMDDQASSNVACECTRNKSTTEPTGPPTISAAGTNFMVQIPTLNIKPWTSNPTTKSTMIADDILSDISLFATFKCMAKNCIFSCESQENMEQHLYLHQEYVRDTAASSIVKQEYADFLECSYCELVATSTMDLVAHVKNVHAKSKFQCQHCYYRSVDIHGVTVHMEKYHKAKEKVVLLCNGHDGQIFEEELMKLLSMSYFARVNPIVCTHGALFAIFSHVFPIENYTPDIYSLFLNCLFPFQIVVNFTVSKISCGT